MDPPPVVPGCGPKIVGHLPPTIEGCSPCALAAVPGWKERVIGFRRMGGRPGLCPARSALLGPPDTLPQLKKWAERLGSYLSITPRMSELTGADEFADLGVYITAR
ncbi:hypothetical protein Y032_0020g222 [Ancylostoma ceylanicum]|uniref:Uncharacterized protein n=1 Tax=Ancylostoma ceylanicum TaxID=53326 RepID=A0A016V314_9BILA|nr:hypothetical protein Y032_0020g222 [Ancylostoma ceylanicum]